MADPTDDEIERIRALLAEAGRCGCDAPSAHGLRTAHIAALLAALDAERAEVERLRMQIAQMINTHRNEAAQLRTERDMARDALDCVGDMLITIEAEAYRSSPSAGRAVSRCIEDAKWRKEPEFSERPPSLRAHIAKVEAERDEALDELERLRGA